MIAPTAELAGLRILREHVPTPVPVGLVHLPHGSVLLFEALPERLPGARRPRDWRSIGQTLARLHQVKHPEFGLGQDGFFGPLPQDDRPVPSNRWPDFYRERRVLPMLRTANDACPHFGHPEIDLAQVDFFQPVPADVFAAYQEFLPIDPGFGERRELWRLVTYLAVIAVAGYQPFGRQHIARLAAAVRRYR